MIYGRVLGSLWATAQHPSFDRVRLVVIVPEDARTGEVGGNTVVAVDLVGSGPGDTVLVVYEGSSSRLTIGDPTTPAEAVVVGIVDQVDVLEEVAPFAEAAPAAPPQDALTQTPNRPACDSPERSDLTVQGRR